MRNLALLSALILSTPAWGGDIIGLGELCRKVIGAIGGNPEETISRLGQPKSVRIDAVSNPHLSDGQDKEIVLEYPDGEVLFRYLSHSDEYVLLTAMLPIQLFSQELRANFPDSVESIIKRWGEPDEEDENSIRYYCSFEKLQWVDVQLEEDQVTGISYKGYVD